MVTNVKYVSEFLIRKKNVEFIMHETEILCGAVSKSEAASLKSEAI